MGKRVFFRVVGPLHHLYSSLKRSKFGLRGSGVERSLGKGEVAGSIPAASSICVGNSFCRCFYLPAEEKWLYL